MSEPYLIVDGYNLLHAAGMARKTYTGTQLQNARRQLLIYLSRHLTNAERERTTIVFDALDAPVGVSRTMTVEGMLVEFAPPGGDADTVIEEILLSHPAPRSVRVVSSDHRLQKAARRRRGEFVDSDAFVAELEHRGPIAEQARPTASTSEAVDPKFGGKAPDEETALWLRVFGEIPEASQLQAEADQWRNWTEELRKELEAELDRQNRKQPD